MTDYTVFDLETSGMSTRTTEIIEIGALKIRNDKVVDTFQALVKPKKRIDPRASAVNHITDDMVKNCPPIEDVLPRFAEFIGDDILVGHNIKSFDIPIIRRYFAEILKKDVTNETLDTLYYARARFDKTTSCSLEKLSIFFGLDTEGEHRSLADCYLTKSVYERLRSMKPDKSAHGITK